MSLYFSSFGEREEAEDNLASGIIELFIFNSSSFLLNGDINENIDSSFLFCGDISFGTSGIIGAIVLVTFISSSFLLKGSIYENIDSFLLFCEIGVSEDIEDDDDEEDVEVVDEDDEYGDDEDDDEDGEDGEDEDEIGIIVLFTFNSSLLIISGNSSFLLKDVINENIELFLSSLITSGLLLAVVAIKGRVEAIVGDIKGSGGIL